MSKRDTQFSGYAKAVLEKLLSSTDANFDTTDKFIETWEAILARADYDLVAHTLWHTAVIDLERLSIAENVAKIPDMAGLPEETNE